MAKVTTRKPASPYKGIVLIPVEITAESLDAVILGWQYPDKYPLLKNNLVPIINISGFWYAAAFSWDKYSKRVGAA